MAERLDVAGRLAEGWVAAERTQRYVRACHALGYEHPDLTSHPSRIRDWYDSEDGLDLHVLDEDCAQLRAASGVAAEALRMQHAQLSELATAWTGPGADAALRLLERHCDAASAVANELRATAQRCESLRDNLWFLVDSKAATAIAIDDRTVGERSVWLGAADTVTGGAGNREAAEDVVRQRVIPYVDSDIRDEWLDTMRSTVSGVATSYDMVIDRMAATPAVRFEFPDDLGPSGPTLPTVIPRPAETPAPVVPAAYPSAAPDPGPAANASTPATTELPATPPIPDLGTMLGDAPAMPEIGGGSGGLGGAPSGLSGLGGLANRIVDAMSDLFGSAADPLNDPSMLDGDASDGEPFDQDAFKPDDENKKKDDGEPDAEADGPDEPQSADEPKVEEVAAPVNAPPPAGAPPPVAPPADEAPKPPAPPGIASAPPASGPPDGSTPCEIAADALPQAGR